MYQLNNLTDFLGSNFLESFPASHNNKLLKGLNGKLRCLLPCFVELPLVHYIDREKYILCKRYLGNVDLGVRFTIENITWNRAP